MKRILQELIDLEKFHNDEIALCGEYYKKTIGYAAREARIAWLRFLYEVMKAFKIEKIGEWIEKKLRKFS